MAPCPWQSGALPTHLLPLRGHLLPLRGQRLATGVQLAGVQGLGVQPTLVLGQQRHHAQAMAVAVQGGGGAVGGAGFAQGRGRGPDVPAVGTRAWSCNQTCHQRLAGKLVLNGHSVIPAPPHHRNSVGTCCVQRVAQ